MLLVNRIGSDFGKFGIDRMNTNEQKEVNGGLLGWDNFVVGVAIYVACEVIDGVARYAGGERKR